MICLVGLILFGILGIVSVTYRSYFFDALQCLRDRARRQPCSSGFDEEYRALILGRLLPLSPRLARFVNRHFALLNWILLGITLILLIQTAEGLYNYLIHGNCTPTTPGCSINDATTLINQTQ